MKEADKSFDLGGGFRLKFSGGDVNEKDVVEEAKKVRDEVDKAYANPNVQILSRVRYMFEHKGLPFVWLKNPSSFTEESTPEFLEAIWQSAIKFEGRGLPIGSLKISKIEHLEVSGTRVILLRPLFPPMIPFCYRIAMVDADKPLYLTQERTSESMRKETKADSALCSWEPVGDDIRGVADMRHGNYLHFMSRRRSAMMEAIEGVLEGRLKAASLLSKVTSSPGYGPNPSSASRS